MPAVSRKQQRLFYAALAKKKLGRIGGGGAAAQIARTVSTEKIKHFTKLKGK